MYRFDRMKKDRLGDNYWKFFADYAIKSALWAETVQDHALCFGDAPPKKDHILPYAGLDISSMRVEFYRHVFSPETEASYPYKTGIALAYLVAMGFVTQDRDYEIYQDQFVTTLPLILSKIQMQMIKKICERIKDDLSTVLPKEPKGVRLDFANGFRRLDVVKLAPKVPFLSCDW